MAGDAFSLADISAYTIEVFLNDQIVLGATAGDDNDASERSHDHASSR